MSESSETLPKLKVIKGGLGEGNVWESEHSEEELAQIAGHVGEGVLAAIDSSELAGKTPKRGTKRVPQIEEHAKAKSLIESLKTPSSGDK